jgi:hypothetical protein
MRQLVGGKQKPNQALCSVSFVTESGWPATKIGSRREGDDASIGGGWTHLDGSGLMQDSGGRLNDWLGAILDRVCERDASGGCGCFRSVVPCWLRALERKWPLSVTS